MFVIPANFAVADANTDRLIAADKYYRVYAKYNFNDNWHLNAQVAYVHRKWSGYSMWADASIPVSDDTLPGFNFRRPGNVDSQQNIYIAKMKDSLTIDGGRIMISTPTYNWEKAGAPPAVNEGPEAIINNNGRLFYLFSKWLLDR